MTNLLLVEDDELLAEQTRQALSRHGVQVTVAHNGPATLAVLQQLKQLDAAVLDQNLGPDNGLGSDRTDLERFPGCRVLLLTGYGSIAAAVATTHQGVDYLTKPATRRDILEALAADPSAWPPPCHKRRRRCSDWNGNTSSARSTPMMATFPGQQTLGIHRRTLQRRLKKRPSASEYPTRKRPADDAGQR